MSVAFVFESDQVGVAEYDQLMKELGRESVDVPGEPGFLAHLAGPMPGGGWRVIDVWESEDAAQTFYGSAQFEPVRSASEAMGIEIVPWPLHRTEIERAFNELAEG